jgi:NADH-quinone oxidoreductase subunit C
MSEENKPLSPSGEAQPVELKPVAAAKPAAEEKPPIDPGPLGHQLVQAGIDIEPLGFDAAAVEMFKAHGQTAIEAADFLKNRLGFDLLVSVTGVDWKTHRESVYHLFSTQTFQYVVLKVAADAEDRSPSMHPIWPAADWHERESYDLMGICYEGHPDMRRILMPDDWVGHPLRKDYKENDPRLVWNQR